MRKAYRILSTFLLCAAMMLTLVSCGNSNGPFELDGMTVSDLQIAYIEGETYNFIVGIKNPSNESKKFDVGKFELLLLQGDEKYVLPHTGGLTDCKADNYEKFSFLLGTPRPKIKLGDSVTIMYEDKELCTIKITEI